MADRLEGDRRSKRAPKTDDFLGPGRSREAKSVRAPEAGKVSRAPGGRAAKTPNAARAPVSNAGVAPKGAAAQPVAPPEPTVPAADTLPQTTAEFERLVALGFDAARAWTSALFYHDSCVQKAFAHRNIGARSSFSHDPSPTPRLFVGRGCQVRAAAAAGELSPRPFIFAHDHPYYKDGQFKKFGGSKMYITLSAWQILCSLNVVPQTRRQNALQFFRKGGVAGTASLARAGHEHLAKVGQPVEFPPLSSLYVERGADFGEGVYVFNMDIDGKVCMSEEGRAAASESEGARVARLFEQPDNGDLPRLVQISDIVGETMRQFFGDALRATPRVSWHKSLGWKPSWRGYVLGPLFASAKDALRYFQLALLPALQMKPWYVKDLFDDHSYHKGVDRCLGSAKFESGDGGAFYPRSAREPKPSSVGKCLWRT